MEMKSLSVRFVFLVAIFCNRVQGKCNPLCGTGVYHAAGTCLPSGRCLCFWGWTGPNAQYTTNNKILADYCRIPCHYTHDYKNPECVNSNHTGGECKVPTSTTPKTPCNPKCGIAPYHGRGQCLSDGRCLCWWGWTGPGACYVEDGQYKNRIIANYCGPACHYTQDYKNPKCLNGSWVNKYSTMAPTQAQTTETPTTEIQTTTQTQTQVPFTQVPCDPLCGTGVYHMAGTCLSSGRCLCHYGWTGPNAQYITGNRILADFCRVPCHYTHDYKNPECVNSNHTGGECKVPTSTKPTTPCDPRCGNPPYHGRGLCLSNGRCLCWWGWTGPNACFVEDGTYKNRLIADYCITACHYTHVVRNATCLNGTWPDTTVIKKQVKSVQTSSEISTSGGFLQCKLPLLAESKVPCDERCGNPLFPRYGRGKCLRNGRCLCWWGWTGPNACYVNGSKFQNRIIANYCASRCIYSPHIRTASCLSERNQLDEDTSLD